MSEALVTLRPLAREDAAMVLRWRNSDAVAGFALSDRRIAPEEHAAWLDRVLAAQDSRHWIIEAGSRPVGLVDVDDIDESSGTCRWGFYVADAGERRRGVGVEALRQVLRWAFEERGLRKVCAEVLATNTAGLAVHRKLGFAEEGVAPERAEHAGGRVDLVLFGLTAEAWRG